jgi:DNA replication protein DnaC
MTIRWPLAVKRVRHLDEEDMVRMRIGRDFWSTQFDLIPNEATHKEAVGSFIKLLHKRVGNGDSLLLCGDYGCGKTGCGVLILKECAARGGRGLMIRAEEIQSAVVEKTPFDSVSTLWDRMRMVDVLLLDDLRREHVRDFGKSVIESLIRRRSDDKLTTIITTNASPSELSVRYEAAVQVLKKCGELVLCDGVDFRGGGE